MALNPRIAVSTSTLFGWQPKEYALDRELVIELARTGVAGLELALDDQLYSLERVSAATVKSALDRTGLQVSGLALTQLAEMNPAAQSAEARGRALRTIRRACRLAEELGAGYVVVGPGLQERAVPYDATVDAARQTLGQAARYAAEEGVLLLVENASSGFLPSSIEFRTFIEDVGSDSLAVCLDLGNVLAAGQPYPDNWVRELGQSIFLIHAKDFATQGERGARRCGAGEVPWHDCFEALLEIGYSGSLVVETPPSDDAVTRADGLGAAAESVAFLIANLPRPALEEVQQ